MHHDKHHAACISKYNNAVERTEFDRKPIEEVIKAIAEDTSKVGLFNAYRGCKVAIDRDEVDGACIYAAWVNHDEGCAVAVKSAMTTKDEIHHAIRQAKHWIDRRY